MRIGIDCRSISDPSGIGTYTREIVRHLLEIDRHNEYVLFFFDDCGLAGEFAAGNSRQVSFPARRWKRFLPIVYSHFILARAIMREHLDVCFFPANVIPLGYRGRAVLTIHDLAVYMLPGLFPDKIIHLDRRIVVPHSLRSANRIVAVSKSTKRDIIDLFGIDEAKISVVYEAAGELSSATPVVGAGKNDFLFLGTVEPRKNIARIIEAFVLFARKRAWPGNLVIAGKKGWKYGDVFRKFAEANAALGREAVRYVGPVPSGGKAALYAGAMALAYPSLYEGFGLPVLEAMASGVPVITSNISSLPEIAGDAALLVDPNNVSEIADAMGRLASDEALRSDLAQRGRKKSQEYSWDKCARETLGILESA